MDAARLATALSGLVGPVLAADLVGEFIKLRRDVATRTLERASLGKFVETFVQALQFIATGAFDTKPSVDDYLDKKAINELKIPEDLRICGARIARSVYTLRNKRNILHKNAVDPNTYDLIYAHQACSWIVAELLRSAQGLSMEESGRLIALVQAPVGQIIEDVAGTRLVHAKVGVTDEILLLFHSHYPDPLKTALILSSLSRRAAKSVTNRLGEMETDKRLQRSSDKEWHLTQSGYQEAIKLIEKLQK